MTWLWRWGPAVACMVAIFIASSIPDLGPLPANTSDKVAHFGVYGLLGLLLARAFAGGSWAGYTVLSGLQAWAAATVYGVTDELHQAFVPGRTPSVGDGIADTAGAVLGVIIALGVARTLTAKERAV